MIDDGIIIGKNMDSYVHKSRKNIVLKKKHNLSRMKDAKRYLCGNTRSQKLLKITANNLYKEENICHEKIILIHDIPQMVFLSICDFLIGEDILSVLGVCRLWNQIHPLIPETSWEKLCKSSWFWLRDMDIIRYYKGSWKQCFIMKNIITKSQYIERSIQLRKASSFILGELLLFEPIEIDEFQWTIALKVGFPYTGLYVRCTYNDKQKEDFRASTRMVIRLLLQKKDHKIDQNHYHKEKTLFHVYTSDSSSWGTRSFINTSMLMDRRIGFIKNRRIKISVLMHWNLGEDEEYAKFYRHVTTLKGWEGTAREGSLKGELIYLDPLQEQFITLLEKSLICPQTQRYRLRARLIRVFANLCNKNISKMVDFIKEGRHFGFICDSCGIKEIPGIRWRCRVCPGYDLCHQCYQKGLNYFPHFSSHLCVPINSVRLADPVQFEKNVYHLTRNVYHMR